GQLVAGHGVVASVGGYVHGVACIAVNLIDVERAAADCQLGGEVVGGPQAEGVLRRVGHLVAFVGACTHNVCTVADSARIYQLAFQVAVASEYLPLVSDFSAGRQLQAIDSGFAAVFEGVGTHQNSCVFLLCAEHGSS